MKLNSLSAVKIEDAVFYIKMSWGKYRDIAKKQQELEEEQTVEFMEEVIKDVVVRVSGIVDEDGNEVAWTPQLLDELSPDTIKRLAEGIFGIGMDNSTDPFVETGQG